MYQHFYAIVGLVLLASLDVDGLYCFKCLNIDCNADDPDCQPIRAFVQSELRKFYYFMDYMDPCPQLNETYTWRLMQATDEMCPAEKANEATCTLGHMQIKTTQTSPNGKSETRVNYATVMGCANRQLLLRIKSAVEQMGSCDYFNANQTGVGVVRELQIEHCREISKQCYEKDYCIDWKKSIIKPWADPTHKGYFDWTLKIGIFAVVIVVIFALLCAGMFYEPLSRPSNFPKTIGEDSETVKVLHINGKGSLSSIEVCDEHIAMNGNGTMSKRPKLPPPPPPPRQHRPVTRESTPV